MLPSRPPSYCRNDRVRLLNRLSNHILLLHSKTNNGMSLSLSYIIAVSTLKTGPRYFSLFLMLGGLFGSYNVALAVNITLLLSVLLHFRWNVRADLPITITVDLVNIPSSSCQASSCLCYHQQSGVCCPILCSTYF